MSKIDALLSADCRNKQKKQHPTVCCWGKGNRTSAVGNRQSGNRIEPRCRTGEVGEKQHWDRQGMEKMLQRPEEKLHADVINRSKGCKGGEIGVIEEDAGMHKG
ncbi:hypothetical protein WR25_11613 [Diploscapter pachys]|jgi:hypothetical protein|uniref:Uncharacterized protein n=1 Tax=Diploscapter pachys TaxID=2018661 RepID=A0A2A2KRM2_9BILA|nr:hypothetical protein WR25_11613 [Diploscapter pachys]